MTPPAIHFEIHPSSGVPIYRQLISQVCAMIASGRLQPGDLLPSVRQVAADLEVNMMTISKAYAKLESEGVVERDRGVGMRVAKSATEGSAAKRQKELRPEADRLAVRAWQLRLSDEQVLEAVASALREQARQRKNN